MGEGTGAAVARETEFRAAAGEMNLLSAGSVWMREIEAGNWLSGFGSTMSFSEAAALDAGGPGRGAFAVAISPVGV